MKLICGRRYFIEFMDLIPPLPVIQTSLQPYAKSKELFHCPADTGLHKEDFPGLSIDASPSSYAQFGTSYYYRTELAARRSSAYSLPSPPMTALMYEGDGKWHGSASIPDMRYNTVFGEGHTKSLIHAAFTQTYTSDL